jgi:hypothetical protein
MDLEPSVFTAQIGIIVFFFKKLEKNHSFNELACVVDQDLDS